MMVRRTSNGGAQASPILDKLALLLEEAKAEKHAWSEEDERVTKMVLDALEGRKSHAVADGNDTVTMTAVHGDDVVLDEVKLRKRIGPAMWNLITSTVLDKKKLEAAMVTGQVDPAIVAECSTLKPRKSYVLVKRSKSKGGRSR